MLQHGAYTLLMDAIYDREKFPTLEQAIDWVWASNTDEIEAVKFVIDKFFTFENGVYCQSRMKESISNYQAICDANSINGKKGGRPKGKQQEKANKSEWVNLESESVNLKSEPKANESEAKANESEAKPNQEPRTNNQEPIPNTQEPIPNTQDKHKAAKPPSVNVEKSKKFNFKKAVLSLGVSEEVAAHWLQVRKNKKSANTQHALNLIIKQAEQSGMKPSAAITYAANENWAGFKSEWLENKANNQSFELEEILTYGEPSTETEFFEFQEANLIEQGE